MALLGDDGLGFDLARRLDVTGVWRTWLGDSIYSSFHHYLCSPSTWEAFMRVDDSKTRSQIQLQLRVRALLFDKATVSLFLPSNTIATSSSSPSDASSVTVSKLNPNYLQLHGDDVYYTLEKASLQDGGIPHHPSLRKSQSKPRGSESDFRNLSQRSRFEELPDSWYTQFISRYGFKYGMSIEGQESDKRTPEGMSDYLRVVDCHKRKRTPFLEDPSPGSSNHMSRSSTHPRSAFDGSTFEDDILLFPETMFRMNCVPETSLSPISTPQMVNSQTFQQQQQLERLRRRQVTSPRPTMDVGKDQLLVQVKLENPSEMAVDGNAFNPLNSNLQKQQPCYNQFRQLASMQIPQMQTPTPGTVRAQPVKVERFEELMGRDSSVKHESNDKLRSPPI